MKHDEPKTAADLARAVSASMKSSKTSRAVTSNHALPLAETAAVMAKFSMRYLHKWDSAIDGRELEVAAEWAERLAGLTPEQIRHGLDAWGSEWPPSSEEFRKACLGQSETLNEHGLNFVPPYHAEYKITYRSRLLSNDDRDARRAQVRAGLAEMRKNLTGREA